MSEFDIEREEVKEDRTASLLMTISSDVKRLMERFPERAVAEEEGMNPFDLAQLNISLIQLRERCLPADILALGEPGWRILLELYVCGIAGRRVTVNDISIASGMAQTSSIRYIKMLVDRQHVIRHPSVTDKRVVHLTLSPDGLKIMEEALQLITEKIESAPR